jgi:hypothetical protein
MDQPSHTERKNRGAGEGAQRGGRRVEPVNQSGDEAATKGAATSAVAGWKQTLIDQ